MRFVFREFVVDSSLFMLTKNGQKIELEPRVFELLLYFCRNPNTAISREQLIEQVWQQRIVSYAAINRAVSELRKVIEQYPAQPEIITTISKVGYQFTITPTTQEQISDEKGINTNETQENLNTYSPSIAAIKAGKLFNFSVNRKLIVSLVLVLAMIILAIVTVTQPFSSQKEHVPVRANIVEQPLISLKGIANKAQLSPNGKDLLFIHREKPNDNAMIWLQFANGTQQQLTYDSYYYVFAIFGAENQIIATRFNNLHQRQCEIVSIDIKKQIISPIIACAERAVTMLAYNNHSNTIYFNYRTQLNAPFSIHAYQLATGRLQQLTFAYSGGNIRGDYRLALSPSQDKLAVLEYQENSSAALKVLDLASKGVEYHQQAFNTNASISWLTNSQLIVADSQGVHRYDIQSKKLSTIKALSDIGSVSAHASSGTIVFDRGATVANLYQFSINNSDALNSKRAITATNFVNYHPQLANRSNKVAYLSTDNGEAQVMVKPENANAFKTQFQEKVKSLANFHWSPDDNYLIASINNELHMFNEQTRLWRQLLSENHNVHFVYFANQEQLIFSSDYSGDWQIWQLDINNGQVSQLTTSGGYSAQGDPNDGYLYLTKFNAVGLYRLNLATKEEQLIIGDFPRTSWKKWQLRAGTIYYMNERHIMAFDIKRETNQTVMSYGERAQVLFSVSYDEKSLQHAVIEQSNSNIWLLKMK
ncbi:hypothetical protein tinsulaeT_31620 [Thalassotalea insulae]|uniref:OmpR/PhoB-type domain-containing protein n=1 Tax=Thalassotalea insulae TaxID=2056778 RepID=A0ABQ6GWU2_9GAMM|nr:winged helix-turn-helix domain-containing protein [Thalassotalea insulae]GLX79822.1 hypothetical protein tinsulaeT_31620 [Thalassotalea insulae]